MQQLLIHCNDSVSHFLLIASDNVMFVHRDVASAIKPQVSRRIPVLNLPLKAAAASTVRDTKTFRLSALTGSKNISKSTGFLKTVGHRTDSPGDVTNKSRLQKPTKDSLPPDPTEAKRLQNIASKNTGLTKTAKRHAGDNKDATDRPRLQKPPKDSLPLDRVKTECLQDVASSNTGLMKMAECHADDREDIVKKSRLQRTVKDSSPPYPVETERLQNIVSKNTGSTKTDECHAGDWTDVAKKPRLQKHPKDRLPPDPAEIKCLQNIASKNMGLTETDESHIDVHEGVTEKLRLQKPTKDSSPSDSVEAEHLQNIARLGVECLGGSKPAKVTYVGSGLMSLSSSVLSSPSAVFTAGTSTLSYALYAPSTDAAQSPSIYQSSAGMSFPQSIASHRPATTSTASQTLDAEADDVMLSMDSSVVDTKVVKLETVETVATQSSHKRCYASLPTSSRKLKHKLITIDSGRCLLKYQFFIFLLLLNLSALSVLYFFLN